MRIRNVNLKTGRLKSRGEKENLSEDEKKERGWIEEGA